MLALPPLNAAKPFRKTRLLREASGGPSIMLIPRIERMYENISLEMREIMEYGADERDNWDSPFVMFEYGDVIKCQAPLAVYGAWGWGIGPFVPLYPSCK